MTEYVVVEDMHDGIVGAKDSSTDGVLDAEGVLTEGPFIWLSIQQGAIPPPLDERKEGAAIALLDKALAVQVIEGLQAFVDGTAPEETSVTG